jgi:predicted fused transcriptional regulator/phosphomethylpyrimidine kinase
MNLRFHPHAVERMQERKLTVAELESVIASPDGRITQTKDKSILYRRLKHRTDNLIAAVIIELLPGDLTEVITVLVNFEVKK